PDMAAIARARVTDPNVAVAAASAAVLEATEGVHGTAFLAAMAARGPAVEALGAAAMLTKGRDVPDELIERLLADFTPAGNAARAALAIALGRGDLPERRDLLRRLMADPELDVALPAVHGAGALRDPALLPFLVS